MTPKTLAEWLDYQQHVHPRAIELGLQRAAEVWRRLGAPRPAPIVITIGGTNGKGSTVAFLEAMLRAAGKRVGAYTSPHLLRYNERVRVLGEEADAAALVDAFERIEAARREIPLTYFEFGTLAALWIFAQSGLDVALLEVGLGGRLDAVNIIDADATVVTTVDLDHQDWLGNDIDSIAREKAGIFRPHRPAIIGMREPPAGLLSEGARIGARLVRAGRDYRAASRADGWRWQSGNDELELPYPLLAAPCQIDNAAAAIAALHALRDRLGWSPQALARGVRSAHVSARLQRFAKPGAAELFIDVAHNPQAARALALWFATNPTHTRTLAAFGALSDKDVGGIVEPLGAHIDCWFLAGLNDDTPRGLTAAQLRERMPDAARVSEFAEAGAALDAARVQARAEDRIIAFGSFFIAASALAWARNNGYFTA